MSELAQLEGIEEWTARAQQISAIRFVVKSRKKPNCA
jgi:hypothetical protein